MISKGNILPLGYGVLRTALGGKVPLKVTQYITHRCNLLCEYCGRKNLAIPELTTDEIRYYLREFRKIGTLFWSFNGGECLLRHDLGELIEFVKKLGMKCNIVTNGLLVSKRIDWLKNVDLVITSIDGPEDIQDKIRGKGVYKKNVEALEILARNNIKTVVVSVISNENIDKVEEVIKLAESYGHSWEGQPVITHKSNQDGGEGMKKYQFELEDFRRSIDRIIKLKKEGRSIVASLDYLEDMKRFPDCIANRNCWAGRAFCVVGADGSLYPCAEFVGTDICRIKVSDGDIKRAFLSIQDMSKCRDCYFSCYSEYNLILNNKTRSFLKVSENLVKGHWFWK